MLARVSAVVVAASLLWLSACSSSSQHDVSSKTDVSARTNTSPPVWSRDIAGEQFLKITHLLESGTIGRTPNTPWSEVQRSLVVSASACPKAIAKLRAGRWPAVVRPLALKYASELGPLCALRRQLVQAHSTVEVNDMLDTDSTVDWHALRSTYAALLQALPV